MGRHRRRYTGGGTQGDGEEACKEMGRRMGREMRRGGIQPLSFILSLPLQPYFMNGAVCIPHAAPFSLSCHPLLSPFIIITYYIMCIIQYNLFFYFNCN